MCCITDVRSCRGLGAAAPTVGGLGWAVSRRAASGADVAGVSEGVRVWVYMCVCAGVLGSARAWCRLLYT